jgi:hypothetical protein
VDNRGSPKGGNDQIGKLQSGMCADRTHLIRRGTKNAKAAGRPRRPKAYCDAFRCVASPSVAMPRFALRRLAMRCLATPYLAYGLLPAFADLIDSGPVGRWCFLVLVVQDTASNNPCAIQHLPNAKVHQTKSCQGIVASKTVETRRFLLARSASEFLKKFCCMAFCQNCALAMAARRSR